MVEVFDHPGPEQRTNLIETFDAKTMTHYVWEDVDELLADDGDTIEYSGEVVTMISTDWIDDSAEEGDIIDIEGNPAEIDFLERMNGEIMGPIGITLFEHMDNPPEERCCDKCGTPWDEVPEFPSVGVKGTGANLMPLYDPDDGERLLCRDCCPDELLEGTDI
ncbi:hypothetical protein [Haladaptatus sp. DFWS20]|uniref:hypothetical protein n=1 Tax=Haladaptatus sp. DFWS20 TaxID=3403467 RepID=UPI003EBC4486